jgi:hypothetical protein
MSASLETVLAAHAHYAQGQFLLENRHWKKKSLWYTEQELED